MVSDLQVALENLVNANARESPQARWHQALGEVAAYIAQTFQVSESEVAILLKTDSGTSLRFVYPLVLAEGPNTFPLTASSAAGDVVRNSRGLVENAFARTKHLAFYERVRLQSSKGGPIQKIMAAPIRFTGSPFGAIEVSRKGENVAAAGPDFTPGDLAVLTEIVTTVAPYFLKLRPKRL